MIDQVINALLIFKIVVQRDREVVGSTVIPCGVIKSSVISIKRSFNALTRLVRTYGSIFNRNLDIVLDIVFRNTAISFLWFLNNQDFFLKAPVALFNN